MKVSGGDADKSNLDKLKEFEKRLLENVESTPSQLMKRSK